MLSVAIIARDEEHYIAGSIDSVAGLADEVVVLLDASTTDRTAAICRERGAQVYVEPWRGFPAQRNRALELCSNPWVLFLDADERVTPKLGKEIRSLLNNDKVTEWQGDKVMLHPNIKAITLSPCHPVTLSGPVGYWIPRYNLFFNRRLRGGGWYPDHQLRLLRRGHAHYDETLFVHEVAVLDGPAGTLHEHLLHHNIDRLVEFWRKQTRFARSEAATLYGQGRRVRLRNFVGAPLREFWRRFVQLGGWRDGPLGLFLCGSLAWFQFVAFLRLWGLQNVHGERRR